MIGFQQTEDLAKSKQATFGKLIKAKTKCPIKCPTGLFTILAVFWKCVQQLLNQFRSKFKNPYLKAIKIEENMTWRCNKGFCIFKKVENTAAIGWGRYVDRITIKQETWRWGNEYNLSGSCRQKNSFQSQALWKEKWNNHCDYFLFLDLSLRQIPTILTQRLFFNSLFTICIDHLTLLTCWHWLLKQMVIVQQTIKGWGPDSLLFVLVNIYSWLAHFSVCRICA